MITNGGSIGGFEIKSWGVLLFGLIAVRFAALSPAGVRRELMFGVLAVIFAVAAAGDSFPNG